MLSSEHIFPFSAFAATQKILVSSWEGLREFQGQHEVYIENITAWLAVHTNGEVGSYYFNKRAVRVVHYFKIMDTYIRPKA